MNATSTVNSSRSSTSSFRNTIHGSVDSLTPRLITYHVLSLMILIGLFSSGGVMPKNANSSNAKSKRKSTQQPVFETQAFLDSAGIARKVENVKKGGARLLQGDAAKSVMYLQTGGVKLIVVNEVGKEAIVAILEPGDFLVKAVWQVNPFRMGTAIAIGPTAVLQIEKKEMFRVLHD